MFRTSSRALLGLSILTLTACAGPEPGSPAWNADEEMRRKQGRADSAREMVAELPSWYLTPPTDQHTLYQPGSGQSSDLQMAIDKAVLTAKRQLADQLNGKLSSKFKEFISESGLDDDVPLVTETERITTNLITEANLAGYDITRKLVRPVGTQYRAYVLIRYPMGSANRLLMDRIKRNEAVDGRLRASKAFQELEQDIREARTTKTEAEPPPPLPAERPDVEIAQ